MFLPAKKPDSLTELTKGDPEPLDRGLIQLTQQDYMLLPSAEPMDDLDGVSTMGFPSLPAPPGFLQTVQLGDILESAGTSSLFDSSPTLPWWYPPAPPDDAQDVLRLSLSLSPIDRVPSGASVECMSSSSSVASDDSDGDAGLLSALLVRGCARCPMSRPLTQPTNFTGTCAS